jgi:hypothetical protein
MISLHGFTYDSQLEAEIISEWSENGQIGFEMSMENTAGVWKGLEDEFDQRFTALQQRDATLMVLLSRS